MHRRAFLIGAAGAVGTSLALRAVAAPAVAAREPGRLLRFDAALQQWVKPVAQARATAPQRLSLLGARLQGAAAPAGLDLDLVYALADGGVALQPIWRQSPGQTHTGSASVLLPPHGLHLRFRVVEAAGTSRTIELPLNALAEGDYLVRLDDAPCAAALRCSEQDLLPEALPVFHLQLRAEAAGPDLCQRADLACLAQAEAEAQA
jgi:hypothetical protein